MQVVHYGMHLTYFVTGIECRRSLSEEDTIKQFLRDLVRATGMTILAGPLVGYEYGDEAHSGISGVVILCESHVAIHTYCKIGAAFIDIFSCKYFSEDAIAPVLKEYFKQYLIAERGIYDRGLNWTANISFALENWKTSRKQNSSS